MKSKGANAYIRKWMIYEGKYGSENEGEPLMKYRNKKLSQLIYEILPAPARNSTLRARINQLPTAAFLNCPPTPRADPRFLGGRIGAPWRRLQSIIPSGAYFTCCQVLKIAARGPPPLISRGRALTGDPCLIQRHVSASIPFRLLRPGRISRDSHAWGRAPRLAMKF